MLLYWPSTQKTARSMWRRTKSTSNEASPSKRDHAHCRIDFLSTPVSKGHEYAGHDSLSMRLQTKKSKQPYACIYWKHAWACTMLSVWSVSCRYFCEGGRFALIWLTELLSLLFIKCNRGIRRLSERARDMADRRTKDQRNSSRVIIYGEFEPVKLGTQRLYDSVFGRRTLNSENRGQAS